MITIIGKNIKLVSIVLIAIWMLYSGMMKLVRYPGMEESFMSWGFSATFMDIVAVTEVVLGVAVFVPQSRNYAYAGLIVLMTGALYTHISNYEYAELGPALWILISSVVFLLFSVLDLGRYFKERTAY